MADPATAGPATASPRRASAKRAMVATAHPLASHTALQVLADGGNAMDAAIAAAAVLGVVQPMMSGLGGDMFALVRPAASGAVHSINGSGAAPRALTPEWAAQAGLQRLPDRGMLSASVPGAVGAMCAGLARFGSGRMSLATLLRPAIACAADGVPLLPSVARFFKQNAELLLASASARRIYAREGRVLDESETLRQPELARTMDMLGRDGPDTFYRGEFTRRLVEHSRSNGGLFEAEDMAAYACDIVAPIALALPQGVIYSNPPVAQGVVLLEALGILARCPENGGASRDHRMIEAVKLAFADRNRHVGDPRFVADAVDRLLDAENLSARARRIDDDRAIRSVEESWLPFGDGDTTCLSVADEQGNVVSLITSLSTPFGSAQVVEGTGVLLNNRAGRGFTLDATAPNCLQPGKRTMSTLHTYMLCDASGVRLAGGTSGGDGQPQWNLQVIDAVLHRGMDLQDAIDMPRWELTPGTDPVNLGEPFELRIDGRFEPGEIDRLRSLGHCISDKPLGMLGAAQAIAIDEDKVLTGAADPRADGCALGLD